MSINHTNHTNYAGVRAEAQALCNVDGYDRGLEYNEVMCYWRYFLLPEKKNRFGFELRCEVVMCDHIERCQPGHGPEAKMR